MEEMQTQKFSQESLVPAPVESKVKVKHLSVKKKSHLVAVQQSKLAVFFFFKYQSVENFTASNQAANQCL